MRVSCESFLVGITFFRKNLSQQSGYFCFN